jgi:hypothetical protein
LDRKEQDGDLRIVSGPRSAVIKAAADHWQERRAAMPPGKTLLVIAPSNNDAHEIGMAIRERKRDAGELGPDLTAVRTRDPNARTDREITLAVGDHVRLFNRVQEGRAVLGNNGDVVEVLHADMTGMRARNVATGIEGFATWRQLTPLTSDRPSLAYGYATTIYTSQSQTVAEALFVLPGGSRQVDHGRAYTALSRHQHRVSLIVSEGAERRDISRHAVSRHTWAKVCTLVAKEGAPMTRTGQERPGAAVATPAEDQPKPLTSGVAVGRRTWPRASPRPTYDFRPASLKPRKDED